MTQRGNTKGGQVDHALSSWLVRERGRCFQVEPGALRTREKYIRNNGSNINIVSMKPHGKRLYPGATFLGLKVATESCRIC